MPIAISREPQQISPYEAPYRANMMENTANALVARPLQRAQVNRGTSQTLLAYGAYGETFNPAQEAKYMLNFRNRTALMIREKVADLPTPELEYMGLLLPELSDALFLNEHHIGKVYEKDLPEAFDIAMDWFMHPDEIDKTQIRVGFGGEEVVNGRAPAYLSSAIETVKRVKDTQKRYGNWAIHHELHDVLGDTRADEINQVIADRIKAISTNPDAPKNWMSEIQSSEFTNPSDVRRVLIDTWKEFTGEKPDMDALKKHYHFSDKAPKIVVFNAANAAIEIDKMDPEKTLAARDQTQRLLRAYVEEFHPEVADSLEFQNDQPWTNHDYYTKMLIQYAGSVLDKFDGKRDQIADKLHAFGEHHQRDDHELVMGLKPSELYGRLHPFFFMDPLRPKDDDEKLPTPSVMEPIDPARNVIWHQGPPEVVFGAYRKVLAENMSVSGMKDWLKQRLAMSQDHSEMLTAITTHANELASKNESRSFNDILYQAANVLLKGVKGPDTKTKSVVFDFLKSDAYRENPDKRMAWQLFCDQIQAQRPEEPPEQIKALMKELDNPPKVKTNKKGEDPEDEEPEGEYVPGHKQRIQILREKAFAAVKAKNQGEQQRLKGEPEDVYLKNPSRLELEVVVGQLPVYYVLEGSDAEAWPKKQLPSYETYKNGLVTASQRKDRVTTINAALVKSIIPKVINAKEHGSDPIISGYVREEVEGAGITQGDLEEMILKDQIIMKNAYTAIERIEELGTKGVNSEDFAKAQIDTLIQTRIKSIQERTGLDAQTVRDYVVDNIVPVVMDTVIQQKQQEAVVEVVKRGAVMSDYIRLLAGINPLIYDIALHADKRKADVNSSIKDQGERRKAIHAIEQEAEAARDQAVLQAEGRYNQFLVKVFGQTPDTNGHRTNGFTHFERTLFTPLQGAQTAIIN